MLKSVRLRFAPAKVIGRRAPAPPTANSQLRTATQQLNRNGLNIGNWLLRWPEVLQQAGPGKRVLQIATFVTNLASGDIPPSDPAISGVLRSAVRVLDSSERQELSFRISDIKKHDRLLHKRAQNARRPRTSPLERPFREEYLYFVQELVGGTVSLEAMLSDAAATEDIDINAITVRLLETRREDISPELIDRFFARVVANVDACSASTLQTTLIMLYRAESYPSFNPQKRRHPQFDDIIRAVVEGLKKRIVSDDLSSEPKGWWATIVSLNQLRRLEVDSSILGSLSELALSGITRLRQGDERMGKQIAANCYMLVRMIPFFVGRPHDDQHWLMLMDLLRYGLTTHMPVGQFDIVDSTLQQLKSQSPVGFNQVIASLACQSYTTEQATTALYVLSRYEEVDEQTTLTSLLRTVHKGLSSKEASPKEYNALLHRLGFQAVRILKHSDLRPCIIELFQFVIGATARFLKEWPLVLLCETVDAVKSLQRDLCVPPEVEALLLDEIPKAFHAGRLPDMSVPRVISCCMSCGLHETLAPHMLHRLSIWSSAADINTSLLHCLRRIDKATPEGESSSVVTVLKTLTPLIVERARMYSSIPHDFAKFVTTIGEVGIAEGTAEALKAIAALPSVPQVADGLVKLDLVVGMAATFTCNPDIECPAAVLNRLKERLTLQSAPETVELRDIVRICDKLNRISRRTAADWLPRIWPALKPQTLTDAPLGQVIRMVKHLAQMKAHKSAPEVVDTMTQALMAKWSNATVRDATRVLRCASGLSSKALLNLALSKCVQLAPHMTINELVAVLKNLAFNQAAMKAFLVGARVKVLDWCDNEADIDGCLLLAKCLAVAQMDMCKPMLGNAATRLTSLDADRDTVKDFLEHAVAAGGLDIEAVVEIARVHQFRFSQRDGAGGAAGGDMPSGRSKAAPPPPQHQEQHEDGW